MGQKVNPKGFRIGVYRDWDARWFARGVDYADLLQEDLKIRHYLDRALKHSEVARVEIEKAGDSIKIIVHSARPGLVIGKRGQDIDELRKQVGILSGRKVVEVTVQDVKNPDLDAVLVAKNIVEQIEKRGNYKKAMKRVAANAMRAGATGIKICCSGRLNGAEIARSEWMRVGSVPLHTLRADIDYGLAEAKTTYGIIGIRVWIGRGEYRFA